MNDEHARLFVYGTLMPGHGNHRHIERYVHKSRPGRICGILVNVGAFPALLPGEGYVEGILLHVDEEAFAITDRAEGVHAERYLSLYVREEVLVDVDDAEPVKAWTYVWANPQTIEERPRLVIGECDGVPIHAWRPSA